jgi:hypothetical protein
VKEALKVNKGKRHKLHIKTCQEKKMALNHYSKTNQLQHKVCSRSGLLQGTCGREDLEPCAYFSADLMELNVKHHEQEKKIITALCT